MNDIATTITDEDRALIPVLASSLYPGAQYASIELAIAYCRAAHLDPMQKPVHIVPMWSREAGAMRDVIMPGIGLYRIQAVRSGVYAGCSEPEFGPTITENIGGETVTYPEWCRITVKRIVGGHIAEFTAIERWRENYVPKGGKEKSIAPNSMWCRRPFGQQAKVTEAQALRRAFPEFCSAPTAEEMSGRPLEIEAADVVTPSPIEALREKGRAAGTPSPIEALREKGRADGTEPASAKELPAPPHDPRIEETLITAAKRGTAEFRIAWQRLTKSQRASAMKDTMAYQALAKQADARATEAAPPVETDARTRG